MNKLNIKLHYLDEDILNTIELLKQRFNPISTDIDIELYNSINNKLSHEAKPRALKWEEYNHSNDSFAKINNNLEFHVFKNYKSRLWGCNLVIHRYHGGQRLIKEDFKTQEEARQFCEIHY